MTSMKRRVTSVLVAAATVMCLGTAAVQGGNAVIGDLGIKASAAAGVGYINSTGDYKTVSAYSTITSSSTKLTGGWYVVDRNVKISSRINVTGDVNIILTDGCTMTAEKGINVSSGCKFNVYTQDGGSGRLYAGTTNGTNSTADSNRCGLGGDDATINIIGGQVYAVGGRNSVGIMGSTIRLYWTNPEDTVYASSYSKAPRLCSVFVDKKNSKAYNTGNGSVSALKGATLSAATAIDSDTNYLADGTYVAFGNLTTRDRIEVADQVNLYLASNAVLKAQDGITVSSGNSLNIYGTGKLYAGTSNGSNVTASNNNSGIGSENGGRAGDIIINGGTIYAAGGRNGAGIGGSSSYVEVNGGNVYAAGGSNAAGIGGNSANVRLGWTNSSDSIYATSYNGSVSFAKTLYLENSGETARTGNIGGQTLVTTAKISNCTISFESNGGTRSSSITVAYNSYVNSLPTPTRDGYTFDGWYYDQYFNRMFNFNNRITQNMTLYAKWTRSDYCRVTFNANGGRMTGGYTSDWVDIRYNDTAYQPSDPTRTGYTFVGWYTEKGCYNLYDFSTRVRKNITLYAGWIENKSYVTIKFNTMGGSSLPNMTVDYGNPLNIRGLGTPTKNGYIFDAWYYDRACTLIVDCYNDTFYSDTTLYAGWIASAPSYCTVTYDSMGGSYVSSRRVDYGDSVGASEAPYKDGYDFAGWYTDRACRNLFNISAPIYEDITLYAGWSKTVSAVTITFNTKGGSSVSPMTVEAGTYISSYELTPSSRYGYEFTGWYTDSGCNSPFNGDTVYSNMTLYAGWEQAAPTTYSVTIFVDGKYVETQNVTEGGYITMHSAYYTYDWSPFDPSTTPIYSDTSLYAFSQVNSSFDNDADQGGYAGWNYAGSTFSNAGLIAAIAGGAVVIGGGVAAGVVVSKKKKNAKKDDENSENNENK